MAPTTGQQGAAVQIPLVTLCSSSGKPQNGLASLQKQRGGYYTPRIIASILAQWAVRSDRDNVLEPSAGDGQLVAATQQLLGADGRITAVELDEIEALKIASRCDARTTIVNGDFFDWFQHHAQVASFDVAIGNPPFIRFQHFRESSRALAFALMASEGLHPNRLTNAWLPFVVAATRALRPGGRLAFVLPAELLQVAYAGELREYLSRKFSHITVVTFRQLVFDGILQETVLLLGERADTDSAHITFVELDGTEDLSIDRIRDAERVEVDLRHDREKWTQYYLTPKELGLVREIEQSAAVGRLGQYADVDVGVVTGRNEFFVLTHEEATRYDMLESCLRLVGRSSQTPGLVLRREEWDALVAANGKCYLLQLGDTARAQLKPTARAYVEAGENAGFHEGYKCRIRLPNWWNVPSCWVPDAFLLRQIYDGPRIILNHAGATSTDTIHRIRARPGTDRAWLAAASMNSLTFAFAEIRGRSYGGGVLELEPSEAEGLPFPTPASVSLDVDGLDALARRRNLEETLDMVDHQTLRPSGLSANDILALRGIWRKLVQRRMNRRRR